MAYVADSYPQPTPHGENSPGVNLAHVNSDTVITSGPFGEGHGLPWTDGSYQSIADQGGPMFDTGDLSGDLFPGPQNDAGVPARHVDYSAAGTPFGVPVGLPYVAPIMFVERPVDKVSLWQHKMDDNASPNGFALGTWNGDEPLAGLYVPPVAQYVKPDRAQALTLQQDYFAYNANAGFEIPPALSPSYNE